MPTFVCLVLFLFIYVSTLAHKCVYVFVLVYVCIADRYVYLCNTRRCGHLDPLGPGASKRKREGKTGGGPGAGASADFGLWNPQHSPVFRKASARHSPLGPPFPRTLTPCMYREGKEGLAYVYQRHVCSQTSWRDPEESQEGYQPLSDPNSLSQSQSDALFRKRALKCCNVAPGLLALFCL